MMKPSSTAASDRRLHLLDRATDARTRLLSLLSCVPFASDAGASGWLAGLLSVVARGAIGGPTPLFIVSANEPGAGTSVLCNLAAIIATGQTATRVPQALPGNEQIRQVESLALARCPMVVIDNPRRPLGNAELDSALVSLKWATRPPGKRELVEYDLLTVWWAAGSMVRLRYQCDIHRRCIWIALSQRPRRAESWVPVQDLCTYASANRAELYADALSILDSHRASESRPVGDWGAYSEWCQSIRGAVVGVGLPDPLVLTRGG